MKLSDYVAEFLVEQGVKHTFGITGGAIVHIIDSIYRNPNIEHICTHHEQAAAMAADAYSRVTGNIGVAISTSGPGATNLLTGVCCAYYDSIPVVFVTGQVPTSQLKRDSRARQIGFQETDVVSIFEPVTKYAVLVDDPYRIRLELEKAFHIAREGRPGPVLLDICDDVQRAEIDPGFLSAFIPDGVSFTGLNQIRLDVEVKKCCQWLERAKRPVMILGAGVKLAGAQLETYILVDKLQIPVALTWAAMDMLPDDEPLLVRDFGVAANRAGNFAIQNADFVLALGTRLDTHETGSKASTFARNATKVVVDIDAAELAKYADSEMSVDLLVNADVREFIKQLIYELDCGGRESNIASWLTQIKKWKELYPICPEKYYEDSGGINPYVFIKALSEEAAEGDIIITDAGANLTWTMQGWVVKRGQRLFSAFNCSPMGYSLPASIGAAFASGKQVICIIGDGGIQMNIQELATIAKHELPIKIFLFNNQGYGIIRQTQDTWLEGRHYASSLDSGLWFPNFASVATAYKVPMSRIFAGDDLHKRIRGVLDKTTPVLCDMAIDPGARIIPKLAFGRPIEDASPLLDREEFLENMIVPQ